MYQLQLAQKRTYELIIGIDPQLIEPMFDLRGHIFVKETQRAQCQRQKHGTFYEFENCDHEQGSIAASVRSFFGRHYFPLSVLHAQPDSRRLRFSVADFVALNLITGSRPMAFTVLSGTPAILECYSQWRAGRSCFGVSSVSF